MPQKTFFNLSEEKRNRIIDSAILEFSKEHYKKVTIDGIVNEAGIPKGSFYQYFKNKDDLYQYIFNQIGNRKKETLDGIKKDAERISFKEYIIRLVEKGEEFESTDPKLQQLKNKFINECPQEVRKAVLKNEIPKSYRLCEEVIECYIEKGELREDLNIKIAAYMITSCFLSLESYEFDDGEKIEDVLMGIIDILIEGLK